MPLPVLHSFAGYSIYKLSKKNTSDENWKLVLLSIFLANLSDFDFLPGLVLGKSTLFHRGISHSLGASLIVGVFIGSFVWILKRQSFFKFFLLSSIIYFSHAVLDYFSGPGANILLFWPFSSVLFGSPVQVFMGGALSLHSVGNFTELLLWFLAPETMRILFFEMAVVFSILAFVTLFEESTKGIRPVHSRALVRLMQAVIFFIGFVVT